MSISSDWAHGGRGKVTTANSFLKRSSGRIPLPAPATRLAVLRSRLLMYIYNRSPQYHRHRRAHVLRPSQRYALQLSGVSGDKSNPASRLRVGTYWANDFSKGCKDDDTLKYSDDLARGFARAMVSKGHQWTVDHGSSLASPRDWLSFPDKTGTPFDNSDAIQGVDTTDFAYLVTHGALTYVDKPAPTEDLYVFRAGFGQNASTVPGDAFRVESSKPEWARCIWFNNKSRLGDKSLRWLVMDACESLQLPGYNKDLQMTLDVNPAKMWGHAFYGLNMVLGFTGNSTDAWWIDDRGWDFGRRAGAGDKLADAWTDEAYSRWTGDSPVALACGRNEADASNRLHFDRVTAPFVKIPHDQIGGFAWMWRS
jgi:hypothetical protein